MPENITDLVVRYRADVSDLTAKITAIENTLKRAENSGKGIGASLKGQVSSVEQLRQRLVQLTTARDKSNDPKKIERYNELIRNQTGRLDELLGKQKQVESQASSMGDVFEGLASQVAAAFAAQQLIAFGTASVAAFAVAEKAQVQLLNALQGQTDIQERLIRQATQIQETLGIDDDVIVRQQAFLALQGRTESEIKKTIAAAIQLSAVTGEDLATAVEKLDATYEGTIGRLGKLDSRFGDFTKTQLANGAAIDLINEKYKGFAEGGAATVSTQLEIQKRRAEETTEAVGGDLAESFVNTRKVANSMFESILRGFKEIASRGRFKRGEFVKEAKEEITVETELQFAEKSTGEIREALAEARNKQIILETNLETAQNAKQKAFAKQEVDLNQSRVNALSGALKQRADLEEKAAEKEIQTLKKLQEEKEDLERRQQNLEDPQGVNKQKSEEFIREIQRVQKQIDDITGKTASDAAQKQEEANQKILESRKQNSQKLADLDKKINDDLVKDSNLTSLERLDIEKNRITKELQLTFDASQQTLRDRQNLNNSLLNLTKDFAIKEREIKVKAALEKARSEEDNITTDIDQARDRFNLLKANIDSEQAIELAKADKAFLNAGDQSEDSLRRHEQTLADIESSFQDQRIAAEKIFVNDFIRLNEQLFKAKQKTADIDKKRVVTTLFSNVNPVTGLPSPAQSQAAADEIKKIDKNLSDEQKRLGNEVTQTLLDGQNAVTDGARINADFQKKIAEDRLEKERKVADEIKRLEKEIAETAIASVQEIIFEGTQARLESELQATQDRLSAERDSIEASLAANEDKRQKGIIGDRAAQAEQERLLQLRAQAEARAAAQERSIKRQQFEADKQSAVSKVLIAALVASAESGFNPALTALYEGLALIQAAAILARANPYKSGSKKTKRGLAIVGEEGPEFVNMPANAQVVSAPKTKKNKPIIDAIIDDRLDEFINLNYVLPEIAKLKLTSEVDYSGLDQILSSLQISPELKAADQRFKILKQETFAMNIANSFMLTKTFTGLTDHGIGQKLDEQRRKGTYFRNAHEITDPIIQALAPLRKPSYKR